MRTPTWLAALLASACVAGPEPAPATRVPGAKPSPTDALFNELVPVKLEPAGEVQRRIENAVDGHFDRHASRRAYIMTDKPLYQPGETIWFRAEQRRTRTLVAEGAGGVVAQLVSPRGAVVAEKRVRMAGGVAANDFEIPDVAEGGEYTLKLVGDDGTGDEKKLVVASYEAPRLKKQLELTRKAYGPGDAVAAAVAVARATGEPFAGQPVTGVVTVDDVEVARVAATTDADGKAVVRFTLPAAIARGDGLLTVLASDGGVTESVQKRIPILLKTLQVSLFPEGGDLVEGLPGRVYLAAENTLGKPADVAGRVVDDRGEPVATFTSVHDGMARFDITPQAGRSYRVEITRPAGIAQTFVLPAAKASGCVLRALDEGALDVAAVCSDARTVVLEATLREQRIAGGALTVEAGKPARVQLPGTAQGAVRVTLFDDQQAPLAERLVYCGQGRDLRVAIRADRTSYGPRDPVKLTIQTSDVDGKPVPASLGLAVVDDTVLSYADDKSARILAHLYLEPELGGRIEEPNFYFSNAPEAPAALDLLMGTRGWRRFDWQQVFRPPVPEREKAENKPLAAEPMPEVVVKPKAPPRDQGRVHEKDAAKKTPDAPAVAQAPAKELELRRPAGGPVAAGGFAMGRKARNLRGADDRDEEQAWAWAPVRVFPAPRYDRPADGPRTDFRETIHWAPAVQTGKDGTAQVAFYLSDAVTSFRAVAEGASAGGLPGRGEAVIQSKLPVSLDVHLPVEVSAHDTIQLPVTITNETDRRLTASLTTSFGPAFKLAAQPAAGAIALDAGAKKTFFFPLDVTAQDGEGDVQIAVAADGLKDEIKKKIRVVPLGFPFEVALSGTVHDVRSHEVSLAGALPGSIHATVTLYPSPLATMTQGLEGMIREPGGCFEQTSSSNYPNVMILSYLGASDAADAALLARTQATLDRGYKLLAGYETKEKGYEWFGHTPGHEALTAYGLMEFEDMGKVYDVDHAMVERTAAWLMSRRDGKGGFQRSSEALDSFGRAGAATTDGYIVWALAEARRTRGLDPELAAQIKRGLESTDPYLVGLAANTALAVKAPEAGKIVERLVAMQGKDGSFPGAKESITMSGGVALAIETTSLGALALIKASPNGEREPELRRAVEWLNGHRGGFGEWGSTQSTILALKALTAYADHSRQTAADGTARLVVNGREVGRVHFEKGRRAAIVFDDLDAALVPGDNAIRLELDSQASLPYTVAISYRAERPQSSDAAKVAVTTELGKTSVKLGEGLKLRAHVENRSAGGVPMTLARIGIPGGAVFQTWQLKELADKGAIDFYETRPREVILYWRALPPGARKDVDLDLLAAVPGRYTAPASSAYLYYTNEDRSWAAPATISIER
jgi:hypothetical protein